MGTKWLIKVLILSTIQSMLVVSTAVLNFYFLQFNYYIGSQICSITEIPANLAFTTASMGFLNNVIIIMLLIEQAILSKTYYKFIEKGINYLFRFAY